MNLYEVEEILKKRVNKITRKVEYFVKWLNYPIEESTWQPIRNLNSVKDMIKQYEISQKTDKAKDQVEGEKDSSKNQESEKELEENQSDEQEDKGRALQKKQLKQRGIKSKMIEKKEKVRQNTNQKMAKNPSGKKRGRPFKNVTINQKIQIPSNKNVQCNVNYYTQQEIDNIPEVMDLPSDESSFEDQSDISIKQVCGNKSELIFLVQKKDGTSNWMARDDVIRDHSLALINFYQSKARFIPQRQYEGQSDDN